MTNNEHTALTLKPSRADKPPPLSIRAFISSRAAALALLVLRSGRDMSPRTTQAALCGCLWLTTAEHVLPFFKNIVT